MQSDISPFGRSNSEIIWVIVVSGFVLALASLPYVAVYLTTPPDLRFVGMLLNSLDGDSYLAKMQLGAQGDWLFHLPYTAQDHPAAFVFVTFAVLGAVPAAWELFHTLPSISQVYGSPAVVGWGWVVTLIGFVLVAVVGWADNVKRVT